MVGCQEIVADLRASFDQGISQPIGFRRLQLEKLADFLNRFEQDICQALQDDLGKPKLEAMMTEVLQVRQEIATHLAHLEEWTAPQSVARTVVNMTDTVTTEAQPLGVVLVLGPWNYPLNCLLIPLVGAIAAGNCVLLKPSEHATEMEKLLTEKLGNFLDSRCVRVVCGGAEVSQELLMNRFDYIFFTGSPRVGKLVMKAAAEFVTPVTLELGGKCPVYVAEDADLPMTAKRLAWGKFSNTGQTCVAPDYVMCPRDVVEPLIAELQKVIVEFYGSDAQESPDYGCIINNANLQRLASMLQESNGEVRLGGLQVAEKRFMEPTLVALASAHSGGCQDSLMREEIFGPILPVLPVTGVKEATEIIKLGGKPLAVYVFSSSRNTIQELRKNSTSGAFMANDVVVHCAMQNLPFGGVGGSGFGAYHGRYTFDTFSHKRACVDKDCYEFVNNRFRYPPYTESKLSLVKLALSSSMKTRCSLQ